MRSKCTNPRFTEEGRLAEIRGERRRAVWFAVSSKVAKARKDGRY
jgi:hypothetical protein